MGRFTIILTITKSNELFRMNNLVCKTDTGYAGFGSSILKLINQTTVLTGN